MPRNIIILNIVHDTLDYAYMITSSSCSVNIIFQIPHIVDSIAFTIYNRCDVLNIMHVNVLKGTFMEIVRTTVKEQIYNYLKEQILSQQITPGERINISAVAKELKVSNTPIREALLILEKDGLISNDPRTGPAVIDITPDLFQTIEKAVEILMLGSYDFCVQQNHTEDLANELKKTLEIQMNNIENHNLYEYAVISMNFDASFVRCTHNTHLEKMFNEIMNLFTMIVVYDHKVIDSERHNLIEEHKKIVKAVESDDRNSVRSLISRHYSRESRK